VVVAVMSCHETIVARGAGCLREPGTPAQPRRNAGRTRSP
jgi:hypothetical protein